MEVVELDGRSLSTASVEKVARGRAKAVLAASAIDRMQKSRAVVERLLEERVKVYGLTTGFGSKKNIFIEPEETRLLQHNLIRSHACGAGEPLDEDVVRATILLRANTLARGMSGIRVQVVERLLQLLELNIYPFIPSKGSLGASGDLAPLSHLALVLTGDPAGRIYDRTQVPRAGQPVVARHSNMIEAPHHEDFVSSSKERLAALGFEAIELEAKEGLALNNGTQVMTAVGLLTVADGRRLVESSEAACAMSLEAYKGVTYAYADNLHQARPHQGQIESAARLRRHIEGSQILRVPLNMAWINTAERTLKEAYGFLAADDSPLADDINQNIADVLELLKALKTSPEAPLDANASAEKQLAAYRAVLAKPKGELVSIYRSLLSARFESAHLAAESLSNCLHALEAAVPSMPPVQDNYSLRCAPQVIGAVRTALDHAEGVLETEANSTTDNPLIFAPTHDLAGDPLPDEIDAYRDALDPDQCRRSVRSGGNFHGEPVALVMDYLAIALSEVANISERRTALLVDGHLNNGLPSLLIHNAGLNSGFMIPQYTAASLVSENKSMAHPASVDSIPSCENTEDHVSMGTIGARKARKILLNAEEVLAIELFTAFQALHFRRPLQPGCASQRIFRLFEETGIDFVDEDRPLYIDMEKITGLLRSAKIHQAICEAS